MTRTALITGITGQDGAYLAQLLLSKGYRVYGTYRRTASVNFWRLEALNLTHHPNLTLLEYDLTDPGAAYRLIATTQPDELYNLAAQSFVGVSFAQPTATAHIDALGPLYLLEAIRDLNPRIRFYQASTSEMFGKVQAIPQDETTPFYPRSPYAAAKLYAHWITVNYRESYQLFAVSGILFNHESPLRGREFVTRKITHGVARLALGHAEPLQLGNLNAQRDWGFAAEYVDGMWRMLQAETPETFVLATGRSETVRRFAELAFAAIGATLEFHGHGEHETARIAALAETPLWRTLPEGKPRLTPGQIVLQVNPRYYRPAEVDLLIGNPAKAERLLGWRPQTSLETLAHMMVAAEIPRVAQGVAY